LLRLMPLTNMILDYRQWPRIGIYLRDNHCQCQKFSVFLEHDLLSDHILFFFGKLLLPSGEGHRLSFQSFYSIALNPDS